MSWEVLFVESKMSKYLDKDEKAKCRWIIENLHIPIKIAFKNKEKKIEYYDYEIEE